MLFGTLLLSDALINCPLYEEAFQSSQTFRVTTARTFGVDYSKSNAINIQHTHTHSRSFVHNLQMRACVSVRVLSVQCLFRLFTCYFDFWWFCFAFCLFRMLMFVEQGQLLETHTHTNTLANHFGSYAL